MLVCTMVELLLQPPLLLQLDHTWDADLGVSSLSLTAEAQILWDPFLQVWQVTGKGHPLPHAVHTKLAEVLVLSIGASVRQVAVGGCQVAGDPGLPLRGHVMLEQQGPWAESES